LTVLVLSQQWEGQVAPQLSDLARHAPDQEQVWLQNSQLLQHVLPVRMALVLLLLPSSCGILHG